jgi:hypothetical protein
MTPEGNDLQSKWKPQKKGEKIILEEIKEAST